jgi:ferritin-like metal-binding protein YciE
MQVLSQLHKKWKITGLLLMEHWLTYTKLLGEKEALKLLLETLKEEKNCNNDLSKLAKTEINLKAK